MSNIVIPVVSSNGDQSVWLNIFYENKLFIFTYDDNNDEEHHYFPMIPNNWFEALAIGLITSTTLDKFNKEP